MGFLAMQNNREISKGLVPPCFCYPVKRTETMQNTPERSVLLITDLRSVLKQKDVTRASRAESPRFRSLPISKHPASGIIPSEPLHPPRAKATSCEVSSARNNGKFKKNRENPKTFYR